MNFARAILLFFIAPALLPACTHSGAEQAVRPAEVLDLSGAWEKNYRMSDDFNSRFNLFLFDIRRSLNPNPNGSLQGAYEGGAYTVSMDAVRGLARFAEEINRTALLDISQDTDSIRIERDDSFALSCAWFQAGLVQSSTPFGVETCGWNGNQLLFQVELESLSIRHQLTLGPDRSQLNLTTTVYSPAVASPFTMSNFYQRYVPRTEDYDCVLTLSRNNVCSRNGR